MNLNKLTGWFMSVSGKLIWFTAKSIINMSKGEVNNILWARDVKNPKLAKNMMPGWSFHNHDFDDKTNKLISVRYKDPKGQEYYYNCAHKKWTKL